MPLSEIEFSELRDVRDAYELYFVSVTACPAGLVVHERSSWEIKGVLIPHPGIRPLLIADYLKAAAARGAANPHHTFYLVLVQHATYDEYCICDKVDPRLARH